jgi:site-specific DNA-methyltransferase (adenine-specific)
MTVRILVGDSRDRLREISDESVHAVVTSPPYWGLRCYGVDGQLGLERTPQEYVEKQLEVFREVRRVLRSDGSLWLNIADSYVDDGGSGAQGATGQRADRRHTQRSLGKKRVTRPGLNGAGATQAHALRADEAGRWGEGLKPKDLAGIPERLVLALQADGWWWRGRVAWVKPNPMPGSQKDRCTSSWEYVYHLTKSEDSYFDWFAIAEETTGTAHPRGRGVNPKSSADAPGSRQNPSFSAAVRGVEDIRFPRDVWTIHTDGFAGAHFATFPRELARRAIAAATSEIGVCGACGAPWTRLMQRAGVELPLLNETIEREKAPRGRRPSGWSHGTGRRHDERAGRYKGKHSTTAPQASGRKILQSVADARAAGGDHDNPFGGWEHVGWRRTCTCPHTPPQPATVLDPYGGAGTTGLVAQQLGRDAVLVEISPKYAAMAQRRMPALFSKVTVA